jgi:hypothetical protein
MPSEVQQRCQEAAAWCAASEPTGKWSIELRTPVLTPGDLMLRSNRRSQEEINLERTRIVNELARKRRGLVSSLPDNVFGEAGGRILEFELDACFFDGVAGAETDGFFDSEDLPPWDTWISFGFNRTRSRWVLLSWIPTNCISIVERAIRVHMCNAYQWMESPLTEFVVVE